MFSRCFKLFCVSAALLTVNLVQAKPDGVQTFDASTWAKLQTQQRKPFATVFTTTDCAYCPAVIDGLAKDLTKQKIQLLVVVMDGAEQPEALLSDPHYLKANALYAFQGQNHVLRYSVNPAWRGMTPYVALTGKDGVTKYVTGTPNSTDLLLLKKQ